jgi:heat shock protein HslJ
MVVAATLFTACAKARSASADAELAPGEWRLLEVGGRSAKPNDPARRPSLQFVADSARAFGNAGCNRFSGSYTRTGASLQFGPILSTKMACADTALNRQEQEYLSALQSTDGFELSGDTLTLLRSSDPLARLVR